MLTKINFEIIKTTSRLERHPNERQPIPIVKKIDNISYIILTSGMIDRNKFGCNDVHIIYLHH